MRRSRTRPLPLGLDLCANGLSLVAAELTSDGALTIRHAATHEIGVAGDGSDDRVAAESLRAAVAAYGGRERRCVLAAPAADVTLRTFRVPPGMGRIEAERAAALEADSISPLPASERLVSLDPIPGRAGEMLLAVARASGVTRLVAVARAAGLVPVAVDVPLCAWRRALDRSDAVVDWSADRASLTVFGQPVGSTHAFPPRLVEDRLVSSIRSALVDARRSGTADVRRIAVLAAADRLEALAEHLSQDGYAVEPVILGEHRSPPWALAYGLASWAIASRGVVAIP